MKKFWKKVSIKKTSTNFFQIMLDERILKTPSKRDLVLPNLNLAKEIVNEFDQDTKNVNTASMIFYGLISTSLDKIIDNRNLYINDVLDYIDTDLVCYRADNPKKLVELQKNKWDPIISLIEDFISLVISISIILSPIVGILIVILIALFLRIIYIRLKKRKRKIYLQN